MKHTELNNLKKPSYEGNDGRVLHAQLEKKGVQRNNAVDAIKGILIVLVVAGHVPSPATNELIKIFQEWIYIFHMPAFFIVSIYFLNNITKEYKFIIKLLICYIFWLEIYFRYNLTQLLNVILISNWQSIKNVLWFIPTLITLKILFYISNKKIIINILITILSIFTIYFHDLIQINRNTIPWGIEIAVYLYPLAYACKFIYEKNDGLQKYIDNYKLIIIGIFILVSLLFYKRVPLNTVTKWHHRLDLAQFSVPGFEGYFYLFLMMICIALISKCKINKNIICFIGIYSLPIFLIHLIIINKFSLANNAYIWIFYIIAVIFISIIISKITYIISNKFKYIGFIK